MKKTWYQRIWEKQDLENTNPELEPILNPDKFEKFQANAAIQLVGQLLPLTPPKALVEMTAKKLGLLLGQKQAVLYGLNQHFESIAKNPQALERGKEIKRQLEQQAHIPAAANALEAISVAEILIKEFAKLQPEFEHRVQKAFQAALSQTNYQEAVEFFQGFAQGLATQGFKDGKIVRRTDATELHLNMFMRSQKVKKFENVKELRNFLWDIGFSLETLDDARLQKYCQRIKFKPGKRGRPARKKSK